MHGHPEGFIVTVEAIVRSQQPGVSLHLVVAAPPHHLSRRLFQPHQLSTLVLIDVLAENKARHSRRRLVPKSQSYTMVA